MFISVSSSEDLAHYERTPKVTLLGMDSGFCWIQYPPVKWPRSFALVNGLLDMQLALVRWTHWTPKNLDHPLSRSVPCFLDGNAITSAGRPLWTRRASWPDSWNVAGETVYWRSQRIFWSGHLRNQSSHSIWKSSSNNNRTIKIFIHSCALLLSILPAGEFLTNNSDGQTNREIKYLNWRGKVNRSPERLETKTSICLMKNNNGH